MNVEDKTKVKKILICLICLFAVVHMCGCSLILGKITKEIKDQNGEDTSLAVINESDICSEFPESYCAIFFRSVDGEHSYPDGTDALYFLSDGGDAIVEARTRLSGVVGAQLTYGKSDTVSFAVTSELSEGNLRIVLIDLQNNSIVHDFDTNGTETFELTNALDREYEIRIAGESAVFFVEINRQFK